MKEVKDMKKIDKFDIVMALIAVVMVGLFILWTV